MCKDCWEEVRETTQTIVNTRAKRGTDSRGLRCSTHRRARAKRSSSAAHARRIKSAYGLDADDYDRLKEFQGGYCAICQRARGVSKRLAVDHCHRTGLVRGLLCSKCNSILGHSRDDPEFFRRASLYLADPPAKQLGIEAVCAEPKGNVVDG
jgi:hypothetical protein